ncbi:zinc-ribbon domain-containing protein [Anaerococcus sp. NML200574]|uniref:zinc-ribbon domain-containing protein n=1 Tax=Anaerococcus sp. NML200574 TaxID=2954486 RepID=UPI002238CC7E|nr:zinc-ribbon domain-containing protein [Anaerococcus sp. NML200574]MCW6677696.1 zinc-ribbon domain-containing protein [Anaerococcus sp. NML200574]
MEKRNGIDEYGVFLICLAIGLLILAYFTHSSLINIISSLIVIYALFRSMSANSIKRSQENRMFLDSVINPIKGLFNKGNKKDEAYKYVTCPSCGQKLRIPKNKGKIKVRCPKCKEKFDAKS